MTPELARELVGLRADAEVQAAIDDLAEKCNEGTLSDVERSEYEGIVQAIHVIGILQRKAERVLANSGRSCPDARLGPNISSLGVGAFLG